MPNWQLANPWGILYKGKQDDPDAAWHAGRIFDVLRLGSGAGDALLVADDASGVWLVSEAGAPAIPLSASWPDPSTVAAGNLLQEENSTPRTLCLAQGPLGAAHVYAGGDGLYMTDPTATAPLLNWHEIPIRGLDDHPIPTGLINRIMVHGQF